MKDKEKRELKDGIISIFKRFNILDHTATIGGLMNDILGYIDSLQEKPVSDDFEKALTEMICNAQKCVVEPIVVAQQWKDYLVELAKSEEPVSEELEKIIEEITEPTVLNAYGTKELARRLRNTVIYGTSVSEELDEVAELYTLDDSIKPWRNLTKEAFKAGANWQKLQDMGITNNKAQDVVANVLSSADNLLDAYATEVAFIMLPATLKESYHQTNRDRIGDAVRLGAKWQKEQFEKDYTNLCNGIATAKGLAVTMAYDKGMADAKEQMKAKAIDATIGLPYENKDGGYTHLIDVSRPLPVGNNKIAIIFKEE